MTEIAAYNEALKSGQYQKPEGLLGKYDNVRRFWEDEVLGLYLRPYLKQLVARKKESGGGIRVLDLGCGSGDGLEFITSISNSGSLVSEHNTKVIEPNMLESYKGIDINAGMLEQAQSIYGGRPNVTFVQSSFNDHDFFNEEPCELYLANYGTLSHNTDQQTVKLLSNIARHSKDGAIIMLDWLGRFAYEWQTLWTMDFEHNQWMDYAISYIYSDDGGEKQQELAHFPLRIMGRKEALQVYRQVRRDVGEIITLRKLADRSSLVGRHMDTAQYNAHCQPLRHLVNSLFEPNQCTNLDEALVHYVPGDGFAEVNAYYHRLAGCWNHLVTYTRALFGESKPPEALPVMPLPLKRSLSAMRNVVRTASGMKTGTPRTSLVEPQLAYCLRELEMGLQRGQGCGHGLIAIFEIVK